MIKNWKITSVFLISSVLVSYISGILKVSQLNIAEIIAATLGSLFVIFLIPLLLTYLIKLFAKWSKNDLTENGFATTFIVLWSIFTFLVLYGSFINK